MNKNGKTDKNFNFKLTKSLINKLNPKVQPLKCQHFNYLPEYTIIISIIVIYE